MPKQSKTFASITAYFSQLIISRILLWPLCHIPDCYSILCWKTSQLCPKTVEKIKALKKLKALSNALQFSIKWERRLNLIMHKKRGITTLNSIGQRYVFSSSREREISFFSCVIRYLDYFFA